MNKSAGLPWGALLALLLLLTGQAVGQESAKSDQLPTGMEVIQKHLKAIGGEEALGKIKSLTTEAKLSIPEFGVGGAISMTQTADGKARTKADIEGIGTQEQGSDGETIWEMSSVTGAEILEGERADQSRQQLTISPHLNYEKWFDSIECTGIQDFDGEPCYVIVAKKGERKPVTEFFSVASGLQRGSRIAAITGMGEMEIETVFTDYQAVEGVMFSHSAVAKLPNGMTQEIKVTSIKINPEIKDEMFDLPADVQALKK